MYAIILLFGLNQTEIVVQNSFDMVELNHVYAHDGREIFAQFIFWNYCPEINAFVVDEWMFAKSKFTCERNGSKFTILLVEGPRIRKITARYVQTTWTFYDKERDNHKIMHPAYRTGLPVSGDVSLKCFMENRRLPSIDRN
jgi:hypothetical protein